MNFKEKFEELVRRNINREGVEDLLAWLETTDFYTSPASTMFHNSFETGLVQHSINVFNEIMKYREVELKDYSLETLAIVSLFHDLCKANTIVVSTRNVKNEVTGVWEKQPFYKYESQFPLGHGEKSVFLVSKFLKLTDEEALAINWHMGGFDDRKSYDLSSAFTMSKLAVMLHVADLKASYIVESR